MGKDGTEPCRFYTPFGVRCFGTGYFKRAGRTMMIRFLYALRREVLRNSDAVFFNRVSDDGAYALRREVLRNPTPVDGSLTSRFGRLLHARPTRASTRSWNRCPGRCLRR